MKTINHLLIWVCSIFMMLFSFNAIAQNPTFLCRIQNAVQVSCNVYEFDVVMQRTGTTTLRLANFQFGIMFNSGIRPKGATINVAMVPGSADALNPLMRPADSKFYADTAKNIIMMIPTPPQGWYNSTTISNLAAGTKICRIRVVCSRAWSTGINTGHIWSFLLANGFATKIFAYTGFAAPGLNTDITSTGTFSVSASPNGNITTSNIDFIDPLAQNLTADNTQVCSLPGNGATISLSNSQYGYSYYLYRNDTLQTGAGTVAFGTDSAVAFGALQTKGVITVKSAGCSGLIAMSNSVTLTEVVPLTASVTITAFASASYVLGDPVTFETHPVNEGIAPSYQWYINGVPDYVNGLSNNYVYPPIIWDAIYCEMISSESCITPLLATSNTIQFYPPPPPPPQVSGDTTICQGTTTPVTLSRSDISYNYDLYRNGVLVPGQQKSGTGDSLVWNVGIAGTYNVVQSPPNFIMQGSANVVVNPNITPTFTQLGPYLQGATPGTLQLTSLNGITGTWNPAIISTATLGNITYTFTPTDGQCANTTSMNINIFGIPSLTYQDIGTTVLASWRPPDGAAIFEFSYRPTSTSPFIGTNSTIPFVKITNLTPGTTYQYRIKGYHANGSPLPSHTMMTGEFITATVPYLKTNDMGTTCQIGWTDWDWSSSYVLQYKITGATSWTSSIAYLPETKLINLTPETNYECRLLVYKGGSLWGTTQTGIFTTGKTEFTISNNTGTALDLSCTDYSPWATSYGFSYKPQASSSWLNNSATSNPTIHLSGLTPNTAYDCRVYIYKGNLWGISQQGNFNTTIVKSVAANNTNSGINIFPNPFNDEVKMEVFTEQETMVNWSLYDMIGKEVMHGNEKIPSGYNTLNIDASVLPKGIYLLNALMNEESKSFKLMKE